jgi:hypothetical protein
MSLGADITVVQAKAEPVAHPCRCVVIPPVFRLEGPGFHSPSTEAQPGFGSAKLGGHHVTPPKMTSETNHQYAAAC